MGRKPAVPRRVYPCTTARGLQVMYDRLAAGPVGSEAPANSAFLPPRFRLWREGAHGCGGAHASGQSDPPIPPGTPPIPPDPDLPPPIEEPPRPIPIPPDDPPPPLVAASRISPRV